MDSLKMHPNLVFTNIQAEDQSEGHHRFSVHRSGGIFVAKHIAARLAPKSGTVVIFPLLFSVVQSQ